VLSLAYWNKRWTNGNTGFHEKLPHKDIAKIRGELLWKPSTRIFFPLCGKSVDMFVLAEEGHEIVGLECSEVAVSEFFAENNLEFTREPSSDGNFDVFTSNRLKLKLIRGDLFAAGSQLLGKFDSVWDRGSLIAIDPSQRNRYASVIKSVVQSDTRYFIQGVEYDESRVENAPPPFSLPEKAVRALFGEDFHVEVRENENCRESAKTYNLEEFFNVKYTLTTKNKPTL